MGFHEPEIVCRLVYFVFCIFLLAYYFLANTKICTRFLLECFWPFFVLASKYKICLVFFSIFFNKYFVELVESIVCHPFHVSILFFFFAFGVRISVIIIVIAIRITRHSTLYHVYIEKWPKLNVLPFMIWSSSVNIHYSILQLCSIKFLHTWKNGNML